MEVATIQGGSSFDGGLGEVTPPTATCGGQAEYAAQYCYATLSGICGLSITLSGGVAGLGASVGINDATVWKTGYTFPHTCGSYLSPGCIPPTLDNYPPPQGPDGIWKWNSNTCTLYWDNFGSHTPIIIDTDGSGFQLTSVANGVKFDFLGVGQPVQIAWTAPGSTNGWLAIDLNGNGTIDDKNDPVWSQLLVWIDANHDGISQPNELHSLDSLGIHSISTSYTVSPRTDQYGNQFHLKGTLNPGQNDQGVSPVIYDVYLTQ